MIFSLILALFFVYSSHKNQELALLKEYISYSNTLTTQTVTENNIEYFIKSTIEKELYLSQNRTVVKSIVDPLIKSYLLAQNFDVLSYNTELIIEIVPYEDVAQVFYQFVFVTPLSNGTVEISPGAVYGGYIFV